METILLAIVGFFKFFDQIVWFIKKLEGTPADKMKRVIAEVDAALKKADEIGKDGRRSDDTSSLEDLINR